VPAVSLAPRIEHPEANLTSATVLTRSTDALSPTLIADTATSVRSAKSPATEECSTKTTRPYSLTLGSCPKYLRYNLWNIDSSLSSSIAEWSETAIPLPSPPLSELDNSIAQRTIADNPSLFSIVTPINVTRFRELLASHPNPLFVDSVCTGLRSGFWPWATTLRDGYPSTYDGARPTPADPKKAAFIRDQRDVEIAKGRFSLPFGPDLLPGMYCMPVHAVPKPNSSDLRMVTDHSAGPFSLNSMVDHDLVTGYPLDNMTHMGEMLRENHRLTGGSLPMVVWKSDIAEAYRLMPLHPFWQLKQVNTVDGLRYIDRNVSFGNCGSPAIFIAFNSLVAWIAKNIRGVRHLMTYMDDSSGFGPQDDLLFYAPYSSFFPRDQVLLLQLWDDLSIPHKPSKQIFGPSIPVIGIDVDPNRMTLSLSPQKRVDLCDALLSWAIKPANGAKAHYQLKHWQQMAGWVNWAFNVYPLLRPCLNNFYTKLRGSHDPFRKIWVNNAIRDDLAWAARHVEASDGIHLLDSSFWDPASADLIAYCDACPKGMGFWYPQSDLAFFAPTPDLPDSAIFFFEALCVFCALQDASLRIEPGSRIVIYTDNLNTVQIFNSLACLPEYNHILRRSVDILLARKLNLRVLHIPGEQNTIADALSRSKFDVAISSNHNLRLSPFQPPLWTLGAAKK
jgi:hypothetical protein